VESHCQATACWSLPPSVSLLLSQSESCSSSPFLQQSFVSISNVVKLVEDSPKVEESICKFVEDEHINTLVMGRNSKTVVESLLVGSVSDYCVANAKCTVVIVRDDYYY